MLRRKIQRREHVPVVFDFGPFGDRIAEPCEDVDDFVPYQRDRMPAADRVVRSRTGHVDGRVRVGFGIFQSGFHLRDFVVDACFQRVDLLAELFFQLRRHFLELFEHVVHFPFASEHSHPELFDLGGGLRFERFDPLQQIVYFVDHRWWFMFLSLFLPDRFNEQS